MKRKHETSFNIAYCGIICALSSIIMFTAVIPSLTYVMPAISGIMIWTVGSQINRKWAMMTFAAASVLSLILVPEIEAKTFFILLFGYYPVLRDIIDKLKLKITRFLVKFAIFNIAAVCSYFAVVFIFGVQGMLDGLEGVGEYAVYVLLLMGNIAFFLYDFSLKYIMYAYNHWIKPVFNKKIK
ncbi:MAG: hypothetical protein FWD34_03520 [Oscillospiraceae bacterium]|nr:hypothetical protein [Oscillospiraceae bacterium]